MAFYHGKGTGVFVDTTDLSSYFNSADFSQTLETAETTGFGSTAKSYIPGLVDATVSLSGMFDGAANAVDSVLAGVLASSTTPLVTIVYGTGTIGNKVYTGRAHETSYSISSPVADVVSVSADFNASTDSTANQTYGMSDGVVLSTGASIAFGALGNLTSVDNAASSASGGMGVLHATVNTITGGTTTIKIQHSSDNSTFADLITFTAVSASTTAKQLSAVSGTVNRYVRATASTAGTAGAITFTVSFSRF